ncbi:hypothetical protein GZ998_05455 [Actinomyces sp. 594]|uniref:FtsK/SpoIIIE domain-containing protein n=1 Tax=Actinomyces sp. 594 TaxID=2057793 RepID=UPI001C56561A|nr:FtsK/SpoIIIE domain-containing protein [Actinomyces sp. 594]MBW3068959.1 hypothetical protein [Actinomyces sp. 594]
MIPVAVPALTTLAPVLVDGQSLILGDAAGAHWADPDMGEHVADLTLAADWEAHFREALRPSQTPPVAQVRYLDTQTVAGVEVQRLPFASPQGQDVAATYLGLSQRLRTTMPSAPFLALLGMPPTEGQAAPGARSDKFFAVVWSTEPVPESPAELPPSAMPSRSPFDGRDGATLVLAGQIDGAFRAVFAAKTAPELVDAQCLTRGGPYIWRATLRLYGGLSVADVRRRADRLAAILRAEWLRVRPAGDLVDLYVGAHPAQASPTPDSMRVLAELDFEQAFVDAGLVTPAGETPTLEDLTALEGNPDVQVHDFALPSGLSVREVTDKRDRLAASTGRGFLRILPGEGPSRMRVLAAARNPIPDAALYDAAATLRLITDSGRGGRLRMPWGVGLDGAPVTWDVGTTPHCLVLGPTGTGKTVLLTDALTGALLAGWETLVIDPVKGGADFTALGPFLRGLIGTVDEAAQCLQAVYQQVLARKNLNAEHGAATIDDLPAGLRPPHMLIVIDEFTSLLLAEKTSRVRTSDPDVLAERAETDRLNAAKAQIASLVGRIGREARSAGVHILLGAQALRAQTLAAIPGNDLKTNTGRLLLGVASYGDLASALRRPEQTPVLTYAPPGRGVWESLNGVAVEVQGWYTPPSDLAAMLRDRGVAECEDWSLGATGGASPTATAAYSELPPDETQEPVELRPLDLGDLGLDGLALE